jgi:hypothetical protein
MSFYDMALGDGHQYDRVESTAGILCIAPERFPRARDSWIEKDPGGAVIALYTRAGGGNRDDYAEQIALLQHHALYLEDADDTFDKTYATFRFRVPESIADVAESMAVDRVDTDARWREAIESIKDGNIRPAAVAAMDQIMTAVVDDTDDGIKIIEI